MTNSELGRAIMLMNQVDPRAKIALIRAPDGSVAGMDFTCTDGPFWVETVPLPDGKDEPVIMESFSTYDDAFAHVRMLFTATTESGVGAAGYIVARSQTIN
jgi:hypothetical protein